MAVTFKDLYDYIQKADVDTYGFHHPYGSNNWALLIHKDRNGAHLCKGLDVDTWEPIIKFSFEFDNVSITGLNDEGTFDTNISYRYNNSRNIDVLNWNWVSKEGQKIKALLLDILTPDA